MLFPLECRNTLPAVESEHGGMGTCRYGNGTMYLGSSNDKLVVLGVVSDCTAVQLTTYTVQLVHLRERERVST